MYACWHEVIFKTRNLQLSIVIVNHLRHAGVNVQTCLNNGKKGKYSLNIHLFITCFECCCNPWYFQMSDYYHLMLRCYYVIWSFGAACTNRVSLLGLTGSFRVIVPFGGFIACTEEPRPFCLHHLCTSTVLSSSMRCTELYRGHFTAAARGWRWACSSKEHQPLPCS